MRRQVRNLLERSGTFRNLTPDERREMARSMVNVVAYLADPKAGQQNIPEILAQAQADNSKRKKVAPKKVQKRVWYRMISQPLPVERVQTSTRIWWMLWIFPSSSPD